MFVGHYGIGLATQAPDLLWGVLNLLGVERTALDPALAGTAAPLAYDHPYSHGLAAVLVQGAAVAAVARAPRPGRGRPGRDAALVLGATACSHWALDVLVHRPDLPLWGDRHRVGLGLARWPRAAYVAEATFLLGGLALAPRGAGAGKAGLAAFVAGLLLFQGAITFGAQAAPTKGQLASVLFSYGALAGAASWLGRRAFGGGAAAGAATRPGRAKPAARAGLVASAPMPLRCVAAVGPSPSTKSPSGRTRSTAWRIRAARWSPGWRSMGRNSGWPTSRPSTATPARKRWVARPRG